jgi:hypothetical protein
MRDKEVHRRKENRAKYDFTVREAASAGCSLEARLQAVSETPA